MSSWRAVCNASIVLCFPTLHKSHHRNRCGSSAPCLRKKTSLSNSDHPFCHPAKTVTVWSPLRTATVESYSTPRRPEPVLARPDPTRHVANAGFPRQRPLFFFFAVVSSACVWCAFVFVPYHRKFHVIKRLYGPFFFGLLSRNRAGTQKGRKRETKENAQCRTLIFVIFPEPVGREVGLNTA